MSEKLNEIDHGFLVQDDPVLADAGVTNVRFYRAENRVEVVLHTSEILKEESYDRLIHQLQELTGSAITLTIHADSHEADRSCVSSYIDWYCQHCSAVISLSNMTYDKDAGRVSFLCASENERKLVSSYLTPLHDFLETCGLPSLDLSCDVHHAEAEEIKKVDLDIIPEAPKPAVVPKKKYYHVKPENYDHIALKDVEGPMQDIQFDADIFSLEEIETKTKKLIQTMKVYDGTDAILVKRFEGRGLDRDEMHEIANGDRVRIYGRIEMDNFARDLCVMASNITKLEKPKIAVDDAPKKRIEWHMHTNMSEMDGVCDPKSIVKYVFDIGQDGIVITDHADCQSFKKAYDQVLDNRKKDPDRNFRIGFGCEFNMAADRLTIVRNAIEAPIDDVEYVSFDLETTGLSCYYDSIIEFGAVKLKNSTVVDRLQMFVKPPHPIPAYITAKTNITNGMVADALPFKECWKKIIDWIGDDVMVAHNATFDYYFLNEELRRIGQPPLMNPVIDTLDMARAILRERRAYKLGNISRYYHVEYDEEVAHRADYDAEALAGVFMCLMTDAREKHGCATIRDLQDKLAGPEDFKKVRRSHICVVAKNHAGIKDLYKLITESNIKTLAVMGKGGKEGGGDVAAEPRILRSSLEKRHKNLLFGTACYNSDVFELACNGDDKRLEEAMSFYDYVEVQPLSNFSVFLAMGNVPSKDRLKDVIRRIIKMAKKLGKPVIADSDAHYCTKDQKIFRDVYIMAQGVGGVAHPLYIRDDALRRRTPNPEQHIRMTQEMKDEFAWLEDPELIDEIVVQNPNKLFDTLEDFRPVPDGTFPPSIEGSDEKLRQICHATAKKMYEYDGKIPKIVTDRLDGELDNIIRNGFGVHYYIAHLLVKKSNEDGYVVGSRGSVGSSFTATMAGITEVNALEPHYLCPHCHYSEWIDDPEVKSGFDLPDKTCPKCGHIMKGNGHNIPFQTFLGFNADKVPDIDLNFSNEYQWRAHAFIREIFGEDHAFRAGTIGTVAEKTAFGYVSGYCEKMNITMRRPMKEYLAAHCQNVKRTTGQHPGGIIIIPEDHEAEDFTPVQYPANDPNSSWMTTHYDFHDIHDNVLKFDILGHVDPTAMRLLQTIADRKPLTLPMNDPETLSLFSSDKALKADPRIYTRETGALGLPEFGTRTTRKVLEETRPKKFSDLVIISGLSHGTDVWAGNAQDLVRAGHPLSEVIGCRDDIMTYLLEKNLKPIDAFKTMEDVRKGRGLRPDQEENMKAHNVPQWYIDSCKKIKYMFPKAHAVAYVMMALRIAWYKVHEPWSFYIQYLSLRCDAYEIETMTKGFEAIQARMKDIMDRSNDKFADPPVSNKEKALYSTLEVCEEMYARGYRISNVDINKSQATHFSVQPEDKHTIIPPFTVVDGLGANVAKSIVEAREENPFLSKEDILKRTQLSATMLKKLEQLGAVGDLSESNQMSLF